jgi:hypothetical protein
VEEVVMAAEGAVVIKAKFVVFLFLILATFAPNGRLNSVSK